MNDDPESPNGERLTQTAPDSLSSSAELNGRQKLPASLESVSIVDTHPRQGTAPPPSSGSWRNTFSSLGNREFRFLWLGLIFTMGGIQMQMVARGYLTYELTSSPFLLGLVNAGFAVPMLALSLFGGAIADRMNRKRVIQWGQAAMGVLALVVAVAITTETIEWYHLLLTSMAQGVVFSFMMPSRHAIIPELVGRENLSNAMALNASAMSATTLLAPTVAGVLYGFIGPDTVFYLIAVMGFAGVVLTGFIRTAGGGPAKSDAPMMRDIKEGLSYIRQSPLVKPLLVMGLAVALLAMPFRSLMPIFVVDVYHRGPESLGLLVSIMGFGSLVGSLFIAGLGKWHRGLLLIAGAFMSGIALLLVSLFPVYYFAAGTMLLLGLGDAGRRTLNQALIMEEVEDKYRGRVMSVFMMNFGLMPLGVLPAGIIAEFYGGQVAIGLLAVLLLITSTLILITQKRMREIA